MRLSLSWMGLVLKMSVVPDWSFGVVLGNISPEDELMFHFDVWLA